MFYHKDLALYKNKNFRSFTYIQNIWRIIEFDLIFVVGMINYGNVTINIESDLIHLAATTDFRKIFSKTYQVDFSHSLILCYDFICDITLKIDNFNKDFFFNVSNCKFYYDKKSTCDEGFIECSINSNLKIQNLNMFKSALFCLLVKELQFVINKNVLFLDIEKKDIVEADIDALFEYTTTYSNLNKLSFSQALKKLNYSREDKELLIQLKNQLEKI